MLPNLAVSCCLEWGFGMGPWTLTAVSSADSGISISLGGIPVLQRILPGGPRKQNTSTLPLGWHGSTCSELISSHSVCAGKDRVRGIGLGTKWPHHFVCFSSLIKSHQPVRTIAQNKVSLPFLWNNTSENIFKLTSRGCLPLTSHLSALFYNMALLYLCQVCLLGCEGRISACVSIHFLSFSA